MSVTIFSINAQGLKNTKSRHNLIQFLFNTKPSVVYVQETNIDAMTGIKLNIPNQLSFYNSNSILVLPYLGVVQLYLFPSKLEQIVVGYLHPVRRNLLTYNYRISKQLVLLMPVLAILLWRPFTWLT